LSELIPLLNVEDVDASINFYEIALGSVVENQWEMDGTVRWARIAFEGGKLMLNRPEHVESDERRKRAEFSDTVLYLMCEDAPGHRAKLVKSGLPVSEISREDYGNNEFALRDPDGYAIRFSSPG